MHAWVPKYRITETSALKFRVFYHGFWKWCDCPDPIAMGHLADFCLCQGQAETQDWSSPSSLSCHLVFSALSKDCTWVTPKPPCLITDTDGNGYISCNELNDLFKAACLPLPGYRVREITENLMATGDLDQDGKISFDEFIKVSMILNSRWCIWSLNTVSTNIQRTSPSLSVHRCGFLDYSLGRNALI